MISCHICSGPAVGGPLIEDDQYLHATRVECPTCLTYSISADALRRLEARPEARGVLSAWSRRRFASGAEFLRILTTTVDDADAEARATVFPPPTSKE